MLSYVNLLRG